MRNLKVVPDLGKHYVHAVALTREDEGHLITISHKDGTQITAYLDSATPSLTPGFIVVRMNLLGTSTSLAFPDLTPIRVHPQETP